MRRLRKTIVCAAIALFITASLAHAQFLEVAKIQASDIQAFDRFGGSVSISGDRAIIGAREEDTGGSSAGAAYIFERDGSGTWSEVAKVLASDKFFTDQFGFSVSISGDRAIVGAVGEGTGGTFAGAAYIFERDGSGSWSEVAKVQASDKATGAEFGNSVSISGDRAIVGAWIESTGGFAAGAAYIFERDGSGSWSEVAKVQASDKAAEDRFGRSVTISGDRAIVGAYREGTGGFATGAAYIFERDGSGSWSEVAKVQASDKATNDQFGFSVSISGERAIVGAIGESTGAGAAGAAYIFERDGSGSWSEVAKVQASDKKQFAFFGGSVSISGERAIVGAESEGTAPTSAGAAYIFERDGSGSWSEVAKVQASDKEISDRFGRSVSISGDRVIVGAEDEDTGGSSAGAAYLFEFQNQPPLADAGDDQTVIVTETVQLDGGGSSDPEMEALTYSWSFFSTPGGSNAVLSDASAVNPTFVPDVAGDYVIELVVNDGTEDSSPDQVTVTALSQEEAAEELIELVENLGISQGMVNSLTAKLDSVIVSLQNGNTTPALNQLNAFILQVEAQRGKMLTDAQADLLVAEAQRIIDAINAGSLPKQSSDAMSTSVPSDYQLEQNYPNPFNPSTTITFAIPEAGEVTLSIYNLMGQLIKTLHSGTIAAGTHSTVWDGTDFSGAKVASGVYVYQLKAKNFLATKKLVLTK